MKKYEIAFPSHRNDIKEASITVNKTVQQFLKSLKWKSLAALFTLIVILLIIIGTFSYISFLIVIELKELPRYFAESGIVQFKKTIESLFIQGIIQKILTIFNIFEGEIDKSIVENVSKFGEDLKDSFTKGVGNIVSFSINFLFMTIALFFMLKDGDRFLKSSGVICRFHRNKMNV